MVIGVGNPYRCDDAAGLEAVRLVEAAGIPGVVVVEHEGEPAGLIEDWADADDAYVVDAVTSGAPAGTVHRFAASEGDLPDHPQRDSSHALGLGDAVALGRAMDRLPRRLTVIGIEGVTFAAGVEMTPEVAAAAIAVAEQLVAELIDRSAPARSDGG